MQWHSQMLALVPFIAVMYIYTHVYVIHALFYMDFFVSCSSNFLHAIIIIIIIK